MNNSGPGLHPNDSQTAEQGCCGGSITKQLSVLKRQLKNYFSYLEIPQQKLILGWRDPWSVWLMSQMCLQNFRSTKETHPAWCLVYLSLPSSTVTAPVSLPLWQASFPHHCDPNRPGSSLWWDGLKPAEEDSALWPGLGWKETQGVLEVYSQQQTDACSLDTGVKTQAFETPKLQARLMNRVLL